MVTNACTRAPKPIHVIQNWAFVKLRLYIALLYSRHIKIYNRAILWDKMAFYNPVLQLRQVMVKVALQPSTKTRSITGPETLCEGSWIISRTPRTTWSTSRYRNTKQEESEQDFKTETEPLEENLQISWNKC